MWDTLRWMRTVMWMGLQVAVCVGVCLALQRGSPVQAAAQATGTGVQTQPVSQMVTTLIPLTVDGAAARLPVLATLALDQGHADVTRAIIVIHGALRNAEGSFTAMQHAMTLAGEAGHHALILAPQFLSEVDAVRYPLPLDVPVWSVDGWKDGSLSEIRRDDSTDQRVSSFAVLDALLETLSDRKLWPALDLVVLAGHSAGAQFVQRYAAAGRAPTVLSHQGIHTRSLCGEPDPTGADVALCSAAGDLPPRQSRCRRRAPVSRPLLCRRSPGAHPPGARAGILSIPALGLRT
jgi:pimeloyl-ACP methyl ester carboxylesterase